MRLNEARRIALAAQGFAGRRTSAMSAWPRAAATIDRIGLLQLDSVSVLVRAHYVPVFSRIGAYERAALDRRAFAPTHRRFFEYWAHEASLLPLHLHPLMRWRMALARDLKGVYTGLAKFVRQERSFVEATMQEVTRRGPVTASELGQTEKRTSSWWGWSRTKAALEFLFWTGAITTANRRGFERVYDLTERVLPQEVLSIPTPDPRDAIRDVVLLAARALGVATEADIRDYFRLPVAETRQALAELIEDGSLAPARVEGWRQMAFLDVCARVPAASRATALVSPFDPLIWHRPRAERLFGFHYRIEIYVPADKRQHGYYVLPFLQAGRFRARVDLQADRATGTLNIRSAYLEPGCAPASTAAALAGELKRMAQWLELPDIRVFNRGTLAAELSDYFG